MKTLCSNLLGLPAIESLKIATLNIHTIDDDSNQEDSLVRKSVRDKFPSLFQGLCNLGEPYTITLQSDAKPHSLFTARKIPLPLRNAVREELNTMESMGVISKVEEPTLWCAGMVPVPKRNGKIRICVDLKHLNESVLREVFPLPEVDDALAQLHGAKVFTKWWHSRRKSTFRRKNTKMSYLYHVVALTLLYLLVLVVLQFVLLFPSYKGKRVDH